jgi:hypothetical protein
MIDGFISNIGFCILLVSYVVPRGSNTFLFYLYRGSKGSFGASFVFYCEALFRCKIKQCVAFFLILKLFLVNVSRNLVLRLKTGHVMLTLQE